MCVGNKDSEFLKINQIAPTEVFVKIMDMRNFCKHIGRRPYVHLVIPDDQESTLE